MGHNFSTNLDLNISIKDESYRIFDLEIEFIWVGYPQESGL